MCSLYKWEDGNGKGKPATMAADGDCVGINEVDYSLIIILIHFLQCLWMKHWWLKDWEHTVKILKITQNIISFVFHGFSERTENV